MYGWQHDFFHTWDKQMFACAANQIGKSSIQIRKGIHICTEPSLWPELFPHKANDPNYKPIIWYLYPNQDTVMQEFEEKWIPEFLPKGKFAKEGQYAWKKIIRNKVLKGVTFTGTGVTIYFKTYSQNVMDLQAGTVSCIFCDEELPEHIYPELNARLFGSQGYFSMVFTATLGQDFWRRVIEPKAHEEEGLPDAWKRQISMYDCLEYHDGTKSYWTNDRIGSVIRSCRSKAEVNRRVFGKFVKDEGLVYFGFDRDRNYVPYPVKGDVPFTGVPRGWNVYSGVDIGSGGEHNHPSAYVFVSANKTFTKLRVFRGRRLDKIETTAGDVYKYYKNTRGYLKPVVQAYDWAAKDFGTIVGRAREPFIKAEKGRDFGVNLLNTLFKYGILQIYQCPEHDKIVSEIDGYSIGADKRKAKDDFLDALRYAIASIPVNWKEIFDKIEAGTLDLDMKPEQPKTERERNAEKHIAKKEAELEWSEDYEEEIEYWADLHS